MRRNLTERQQDIVTKSYVTYSNCNADRIYAVADTGSPFLLVAKCLRKDCATYCAEAWASLSLSLSLSAVFWNTWGASVPT